MKRYIFCNIYLDDSEIVDRFQEDGIITTNNPYEAIYLLRDGTLIRGVYEGVRSEDHRCAECLFDDIDRHDKHFWDKLFEATSMVMLHPETEIAEIGYGQQLTWEQQEILDEINYRLHKI